MYAYFLFLIFLYLFFTHFLRFFIIIFFYWRRGKIHSWLWFFYCLSLLLSFLCFVFTRPQTHTHIRYTCIQNYAHSLTTTRMHLCVCVCERRGFVASQVECKWRSKRDGNTIRLARAPLVRLLRRPKINWRSAAAERGPKATSNRLQPNRLSDSWQRDAPTCSLAMRSMWVRVVVARLTLVGFVSFLFLFLFLSCFCFVSFGFLISYVFALRAPARHEFLGPGMTNGRPH